MTPEDAFAAGTMLGLLLAANRSDLDVGDVEAIQDSEGNWTNEIACTVAGIAIRLAVTAE